MPSFFIPSLSSLVVFTRFGVWVPELLVQGTLEVAIILFSNFKTSAKPRCFRRLMDCAGVFYTVTIGSWGWRDCLTNHGRICKSIDARVGGSRASSSYSTIEFANTERLPSPSTLRKVGLPLNLDWTLTPLDRLLHSAVL